MSRSTLLDVPHCSPRAPEHGLRLRCGRVGPGDARALSGMPCGRRGAFHRRGAARRGPMIRIEAKRILPGSVSEGFAYITDMNRWPEYWPNFVRVENPATARWREPGDQVTIVLRLLYRERALNMWLEQVRKDEWVTYMSHQRGLPNVRHERYFRSVASGFEYRLVVAFEPRSGLAGLFDRILLKRAVTRALHKTIANLSRVFHASAAR
jgi:Polyketide cyclase / dehydrase and lipid transport